MNYWYCPICQGMHSEYVFECPFGPSELDEDEDE